MIEHFWKQFDIVTIIAVAGRARGQQGRLLRPVPHEDGGDEAESEDHRAVPQPDAGW